MDMGGIGILERGGEWVGYRCSRQRGRGASVARRTAVPRVVLGGPPSKNMANLRKAQAREPRDCVLTLK